MSIRYILTDGKGRYIKANFDGSYIAIKNQTLAERWKDRNKANNVLKSCLSKTKRKQFHVEEIEEPDGSLENPVRVSAQSEPTKAVNMPAIQEFVTATTDYVIDCAKRAETLSQQLSQIDKELEDVSHFMEFNSLDACRGYKAYKMFREKRIERRRIKDELHVLQKMGSSKLNEAEMALLQQEIDNLSNRSYTPRALPELFEKGDKK